MPGNVRRLIRLLQNLLDLVYPRFCIQCHASVEGGEPTGPDRSVPDLSHFCSSCWGNIQRLPGPHCPVCAHPFASGAALLYSPDHHCGECRADPPAFSRAITPFVYEGTLVKAIQYFKYKKGNTLAAPLAQLLQNDLKTLQIDRVMAIPLHPRRLRTREFNQSLLLANQISRFLSLPLLIDAMSRVRETSPQVGLSRKERRENIRRAFSVTRPGSIEDQRILLIDDVYTTGATLREGAKTLMRAGAKEVVVAAVARML